MKSNKLYSSLAMIAFLLVFVAGTAKATNPFGQYCAEGSNDTTVTVSVECGGVWTSISVDICWVCPTSGGEDLTIRVSPMWQIPSGCDVMPQIEAALSEWALISVLCPDWAAIPPCDGEHYKTVSIDFPMCYTRCLENDGTYSYKPCNTIVDCYCSYTYNYCYDNGIIHKNLVSSGVPIGCPTVNDDPNVPMGCSIYTIDTVPPTAQGVWSECFSICQ